MKTRDDVSPDFFNRFDLFDGLTAQEIDGIASITEYQIYDAGEAVVEEGEQSRDMYLLADGQIDIVKSYHDNATHLARLEPDAVLGELGLVLGEPRSATAIADEEAHLLHIAGDPLIQRRRNGDVVAFKIGHNILETLARRQADMNNRLMEAMERGESSEFQRDEVTDLREQLSANWSF